MKPVDYFTVHDQVVIKITDVNVCDDVKNLSDFHTCMKSDFTTMLFLTFENAIKYMIGYVECHGGATSVSRAPLGALFTVVLIGSDAAGTLASHQILSDLGFLAKTQDVVPGPRMISKTIVANPKHGVHDKRWKVRHVVSTRLTLRYPPSVTHPQNFKLVCTRYLACTKAENFMSDYIASEPPKTRSKEYYSTALESLSRFAIGNDTYVQKHSAAEDVIDLTEVVKAMVTRDGPGIFDGTDQYVNWDPLKDFVPRVHEPVTVPTTLREPPTKKQTYGLRDRLNKRKVPEDLMNEINKKQHMMTKQDAWGFINRLEQCPLKA